MVNLEQHIEIAIRQAIDIRIKQVTEEEIAKAQENIKSRIQRDLATLTLSVFKEYSVMRHGTDVIITVRNKME